MITEEWKEGREGEGTRRVRERERRTEREGEASGELLSVQHKTSPEATVGFYMV